MGSLYFFNILQLMQHFGAKAFVETGTGYGFGVYEAQRYPFEIIVSIDSDGSMHAKAEVLARTKRAKWEKNEISGMKVQVHGTAAVVTGVWTGKGVDGTGKAVNSRERWADTWVKMASGKWQCVASASAAIK